MEWTGNIVKIGNKKKNVAVAPVRLILRMHGTMACSDLLGNASFQNRRLDIVGHTRHGLHVFVGLEGRTKLN